MRRFLVFLLAAATPGAAHAHFYFVLPALNGEPAKLVLSDTAEVDKDADPGPAESFTLPAPVKLIPGGAGYLSVDGIPPGADSLTIAAPKRVSQTNYAVPTLVVHDARWLVKPSGTAGAKDGLSLSCDTLDGGTVFTTHLNGKPVAARVTVAVPGAKRPVTSQTGPDGRTRAFAEKGFYSARATLAEAKPGEYKGQPYQQVRHYTTLTTTAD